MTDPVLEGQWIAMSAASRSNVRGLSESVEDRGEDSRVIRGLDAGRRGHLVSAAWVVSEAFAPAPERSDRSSSTVIIAGCNWGAANGQTAPITRVPGGTHVKR